MWKQFWKDLSKAMLMMDPMAYAICMAWSLEVGGQGAPAVAPERTDRPVPPGRSLGRGRRPTPAGADPG